MKGMAKNNKKPEIRCKMDIFAVIDIFNPKVNIFKNLGRVFSGKIIAGDSAGVNVLGQLFYSKNSKEIGEGLKILPFKTVVHCEDGVPNPLGQINPELETVFLHEYETKVFSF